MFLTADTEYTDGIMKKVKIKSVNTVGSVRKIKDDVSHGDHKGHREK